MFSTKNKMQNKKRSFFEKLAGIGSMEEDYEEEEVKLTKEDKKNGVEWIEEESEDAELAVDVYQTNTDIVIQTMVAGVRPEDLELSIGRDLISIKGKREESKAIDDDNYFTRELYWGSFSRTISLPQEVEPEEAEATEKHGLLTIKLKKIDRDKKSTVKIKSL
ncbi:MAG: Hsp20/alpha crystallin family protein [Candidatus Pacebacteria bacterium]|nr:Hsp20/alpha crystallin family protein [Candidatus Paceibacterota bacterium]